MSLTSFNAFALTRSEMKNVKGGYCHICSKGGPGNNITCGGEISRMDADEIRMEMNAANDGYYYYTVEC